MARAYDGHAAAMADAEPTRAELAAAARQARDDCTRAGAELDRLTAALADAARCGCPTLTPSTNGRRLDGQTVVRHECARRPGRELLLGLLVLRLWPEHRRELDG